MEEEEIEDHGDALREDSLRIVKDIETLDFEDYLIGVIRQLVGPDLLREQEVYYLPQPGEVPVRRRRRKSGAVDKSSSAKHSSRDQGHPAESASHHGSPASLLSPTSSRAPHSTAESTSTSFSALRRAQDLDSLSDLGSELTEEEDDDDDDVPQVKRMKPSLAETKPDSISANAKSNARRSKRLGTDASAYKPISDGEPESDQEAQPAGSRRKPKRGIKRTRTSEQGADDQESRKSKKVRTKTSVTERT